MYPEFSPLENVLLSVHTPLAFVVSLVLPVAAFMYWKRHGGWAFGVLALAAGCLCVSSLCWSTGYGHAPALPSLSWWYLDWLHCVAAAIFQACGPLGAWSANLARCLAIVGGIGLVARSVRVGAGGSRDPGSA